MRNYFLILGVGLFFFAGCWSSTTNSVKAAPLNTDQINFFKSLAIKGAGKTAVFCIQGDTETRRRLGLYITAQMKKEGFDVYEGYAQIPAAQSYSAEDLAKVLLHHGFQSVAEVTYTGSVPKDGLPDTLSFKLHAIAFPRVAHYSATQATLDLTIPVFVQTLAHLAAR